MLRSLDNLRKQRLYRQNWQTKTTGASADIFDLYFPDSIFSSQLTQSPKAILFRIFTALVSRKCRLDLGANLESKYGREVSRYDPRLPR